MSTPLFQHLNETELARANTILLFADENRLARKPRCSEAKDHSKIRSAANALTHPYIQPNSPVAYARIVFDLDWHQERHRFHDLPLRYLADTHAWEYELGLPAPSWAAISSGKNSAHIGYELETPVGRHEHARVKPQQYLAAIESAMAQKLGADEGFTGQLCKNPINAMWTLYKGPDKGRSLHELTEYVELTATRAQTYNRTPRGEIGRNVFLFDTVRFWAYDNIDAYRSSEYEAWEQAVVAKATQVNAARYDHLPWLVGRGLLPPPESKAIGKSVARWSWANHGKRTMTAAFSELQAWRGTLGAAVTARGKRERREPQIVTAIGQLIAAGQIPTMGKVANLIGCSKATLSQHYGHFFHCTRQ
jgi:hypothetical protein